MPERVYCGVIDRSAWPAGPWDHESEDKVQWTDEVTGLPCLAVRSEYSANWCGYVGVPPNHPLHSTPYTEIAGYFDVHGGLTYSDGCQHGASEGRGICHIPEKGESGNVWWFGFDCNHAHDYSLTWVLMGMRESWESRYRTLDYVKWQCRWLAGQLKERQCHESR